MDSLIDLIKKIGIFLIAAQAVIHFAPGAKYEKYIKMIVSVMILLQFVTPVYSMIVNDGTDWEAQARALEKDLSAGLAEGEIYAGTGDDFTFSAITHSIEQEIKSKLNMELAEENYVVESVRVTITAPGDTSSYADGNTYALEGVRVVVRARAGTRSEEAALETDSGTEIQKIEIPKITLDTEAANLPEENGDAAQERLRERFCAALGMDEADMEVVIYGNVEDILL